MVLPTGKEKKGSAGIRDERSRFFLRKSWARCRLGALLERQDADGRGCHHRLSTTTAGAQELIAEIGVDMSWLPDAAHLVSWANFAPIDRNSAGKKKGGSTGKGNPWLAGTLGEIVIAAARTDTFLAERYRRIARRRGRRRDRRRRQLRPHHPLAHAL